VLFIERLFQLRPIRLVNDAGIVRLGFSQKSPSFRSPTVMRWDSLPGVVEVSMFKGQTGTDYAYVKVKTP